MNEDKKKNKYKIIGIYRVCFIILYFLCLFLIRNFFILNKILILFLDCNIYKLF